MEYIRTVLCLFFISTNISKTISTICQVTDFSTSFTNAQDMIDENTSGVSDLHSTLNRCQFSGIIHVLRDNYCFGHCELDEKCLAVFVNINPVSCAFCLDFGHAVGNHTIQNFTGIHIRSTLISDQCHSNPCQNGGTCTDGPNSYTCECAAGYEGEHCDDRCTMFLSCDETAVCSSSDPRFGCVCYIETVKEQLNSAGAQDWVVIQRRVDGNTDFYRPWNEYVAGFGNPDNNFWLGLDNISALTSNGPVELLFVLETFENECAYAHYSNFEVADASDNYRLTVSGYSGTTGDSFSFQDGAPFTTLDRDNDNYGVNCAVLFTGAWWYTTCHLTNLNGQYLGGTSAYGKGMNWHSYKGYEYSMKTSVMMIR